MNEKTIDVIGFGNPLLDLLVRVDDSFLDGIGFEKGGMHLVDEIVLEEILSEFSSGEVVVCAGGSCANTISGVAYLGGKSAFCGVIGNDELGDKYEDSLNGLNLSNILYRSDNKTGQVVSLITPDSERTMFVYLGAAVGFDKSHVVDSDISRAKVFHIEAYQLEGVESKDAVLHAIDVAKANGTKVSIDLADSGLIERNYDLFRKIVSGSCDIVFVNEEEARSFTGLECMISSLNYLSELCDLAIVKVGSKGSLIKKDGVVYEIPTEKVSVIDTTGAGDNYAAGILYGITNGLSLSDSGRLASSHAAKIVSQIGARLD